MAITNAIMQMRRGLEADFDPDKMKPGEWAVSTDTKYVRMCFSPGVCVRMATYDAFEADMVKIQKILEECQTIEEAVRKIQSEIDAKEIVIEKYVQDAKEYSKTASDEADRAKAEADRAKAEADRAQGIVGGDYVTHAEIIEYSLIKDTGYELSLSIDESTYVMTIGLKNANGNVLSEKTIDFPIESMVVNATYKDGIITLLLQNGETVPVEVSALVNGLVNNTLTIAGIDLKDNITADELKEALGIYPLDSYEEIMANTVSGRIAGANGVKEGFNFLTDSLNILIVNISANYTGDVAPAVTIYPNNYAIFTIPLNVPQGYKPIIFSRIDIANAIAFVMGYRIDSANNIAYVVIGNLSNAEINTYPLVEVICMKSQFVGW